MATRSCHVVHAGPHMARHTFRPPHVEPPDPDRQTRSSHALGGTGPSAVGAIHRRVSTFSSGHAGCRGWDWIGCGLWGRSTGRPASCLGVLSEGECVL